MFPFGSYITQIPLILFSVLYLLYFGAFTLNRIRNKEVAVDQPVSSEHRKVIITGNEGFFHYFDQSTSPENDFDNKNGLFRIFESPGESLMIPPEEKQSCSAPGYNYFCRPPPAITS